MTERFELSVLHRRALALTGAVVTIIIAVCGAALAIAGGPDTVASVPATTAPETPSGSGPADTTPRSVPAYVAAQGQWVECLGDRGVRASGPDEDFFVSVDPDPELEAQRDACSQLRPALSDEVERQLQARAADLPHVPHESGPRAPLDP